MAEIDDQIEESISGYYEESCSLKQSLEKLISFDSSEDMKAISELDLQMRHKELIPYDILKVLQFIVGNGEDFKKLTFGYLSHEVLRPQSQFLKATLILSIVNSFNLQQTSVQHPHQQLRNMLKQERTNSSASQNSREASEVNGDDRSELNSQYNTINNEKVLTQDKKENQWCSHISVLEMAFLCDSSHAHLHNKIVNALSLRQQSKELTIILKIINNIDLNDNENKLSLGRTYMKRKMYQEAIKQLQSIKRETPQYQNACILISKCYQTLRKLDLAISSYRQYLVLINYDQNNPNTFICLFEMGCISLNSYKFYQAIQFFTKCLAIKPDNYLTQYKYAYSHYLVKEYNTAIDFIRNNVMDDTNFRQQIPPLSAANFYTLLGNLFRQKRSEQQNALIYYQKAQNFFNQHNSMKMDSTQASIDDMEEDDKHLIRNLYQQIGKYYFKYKKYQQAKRQFQYCLQIDQDYSHERKNKRKINLIPYVYLGKIYLIEKSINNLLKCLNQILSLQKSNRNILYIEQMKQLFIDVNKSNILQQIGEKYSKIIKTADIKNKFNRSYENMMLENINKHIRDLHLLKMFQRRIIMNSGQYLFEQQHYEFAMKTFQMGREIDPRNQDSNIWIGRCYVKINLLEKAKQHFKYAENTKKDSLQLLKGRSELYQKEYEAEKLKEPIDEKLKEQKAIKLKECYETIKDLSPLQYLCIRKLSFLHLDVNRIPQGLKMLKQTLQYLPVDEGFFKVIKDLYYKSKVQEAVEILSFIESSYHNTQSKISPKGLLNLYIDLQMLEKAKRIFESNPFEDEEKKKYCLFYLKYYNSDSIKQQQFQDHTKIVLALAESYRKSPAMSFQIGCCFKRLGDFDKAIGYLQEHFKECKTQNALKKLIQIYKSLNNSEMVAKYSYEEIRLIEEELEKNAENTRLGKLREQSKYLPKQPSQQSQVLSSSEYNAYLKRLCWLYKLVNQKYKHYHMLEKVVQLKPPNSEYLMDMIDLELQFSVEQSKFSKKEMSQKAIKNISTLFASNPPNNFAYEKLIKFFQVQYQNHFLQQPKQKMIEFYLTQTLKDNPLHCSLFYLFVSRFNKSFEHFSKIIQQYTQSKKNQKNENMKKGEIFRIIGHLKIAQNRFKSQQSKWYIVIMRGILHHQVGSVKLAKQSFVQLVQMTAYQKISQVDWFRWFASFLQTIFNSSIILQFVLIYMYKESLGDAHKCYRFLTQSHPTIKLRPQFYCSVANEHSKQSQMIEYCLNMVSHIKRNGLLVEKAHISTINIQEPIAVGVSTSFTSINVEQMKNQQMTQDQIYAKTSNAMREQDIRKEVVKYIKSLPFVCNLDPQRTIQINNAFDKFQCLSETVNGIKQIILAFIKCDPNEDNPKIKQ